MQIFSKGFNFGQDGPGNRLVYHLQGCNMRCIWCSNPEGMKMDGGEEYSVEEIFDESKRSRPMFFSGGGVTFTGGEATLWHTELLRLLKLLRKENIHTCIETNGTSYKLSELLPCLLCLKFREMPFCILKELIHLPSIGWTVSLSVNLRICFACEIKDRKSGQRKGILSSGKTSFCYY